LAIAVLAAIVSVVFIFWRPLAVETVYPVERARSVWAKSFWVRVKGVFQGANAAAENLRLKREVAALALLKGEVARVEAENRRLRKMVGYAARAKGEWIAAGILSRGGGAGVEREMIRVDKGSLAGIREGAVVVVPDGLVGQVRLVTPHTAEVALISDRRVRVACEIEQAQGVPARGVLAGGTDALLDLRHLTNAEQASAQARVLTSGLGGVFPKGLAIGTLQAVRKDENGLACRGEVRPFVDFLALEDVFIRREK
jgi:rod shape-determining protein MreC